jgi:hypothetical protein
LDFRFHRYVTPQRSTLNFLSNGPGRGLVDVTHDNAAGTFPSESKAERPPNTVRAARDNDYFVAYVHENTAPVAVLRVFLLVPPF